MEWDKKWPASKAYAGKQFQALLTFDKNLQYQQNLQKYTIAVFVLSAFNNTYVELTKLSPRVHEHLNKEGLPVGPIIITVKLSPDKSF